MAEQRSADGGLPYRGRVLGRARLGRGIRFPERRLCQ
jgi:hypothetical protein